MDNRCVSCGEIIPEGRQVCPKCESDRNARCDYMMKADARSVKKVGKVIGVTIGIITIIIALVFSWLIACGIIKAITLCFGWEFSLTWTTGIWFALTIFAGILGWIDDK